MKIATLVFLSFFCAMEITAQNIPGEYYLHGVMEVGTGFQLNADSSFEFFFSYGALDRYGKGKWSLQNDSVIILNGEKRPPFDFKLEKNSITEEKRITIQVDDANKNILRYVQGFIKTKSGEIPFEMNNNGIAQLKIEPVDSIGLIFTLCPDRYSVFAVTNRSNYFLFKIEPWIAEVFFENFILKYADNMLTGKHPLLKEKEYSYEKE